MPGGNSNFSLSHSQNDDRFAAGPKTSTFATQSPNFQVDETYHQRGYTKNQSQISFQEQQNQNSNISWASQKRQDEAI